MHRKQVISSGQLGIMTVEEGILSSGRRNGQYNYNYEYIYLWTKENRLMM